MAVTPMATGQLTEAQIVMFARDGDELPENNLANIYGYPFEVNVWIDGINGGPDSFNDNAATTGVPGHIDVLVNDYNAGFSLITVEEFGTTGPPQDPMMFKTFLVTIDLSGAGIMLNGGQEYVFSVINDNRGNPLNNNGTFRISYSDSTAPDPNGNPFEDLYQQWDTVPTDLPGFVETQHGFGFEQFGVKLTSGNGDFDGDNDADGFDFLEWQRNFGGSVTAQQDTNGDGIADGKDLNVWEATYGSSWANALSANVTVPEPCGLILLLSVMGWRFISRRPEQTVAQFRNRG